LESNFYFYLKKYEAGKSTDMKKQYSIEPILQLNRIE